MKCDQSIRNDDPWVAAMRRGDFELAWRISDDVLAQRRADNVRCSHWPRHRQFIWRGESFDAQRVLVRCYHGLGDTVQFARFAAPLRQRARQVTFWAQPALLPLLRTVRGIDRCVPLHDGAPDVEYDVDIESMELLHALRCAPNSLADEVPYLGLTPSTHVVLNAAARLKVGIAWRAGEWNLERSLSLRELRQLRASTDVQFFSLQYPPEPLGNDALRAVDLSCRDIARLAARMQQLDLVISVDTLVAHLAGAMGLPVWTLLHDDCDWRWLQARSDSPWYPTMRLFRQHRAGEWRDVIAGLAASLRRMVCSRPQRLDTDAVTRLPPPG